MMLVCSIAGQVTGARYHRVAPHTHHHHLLDYAILHAQSSTARWDLPAGLVFVSNGSVINILSRQEPRHLVAERPGVALGQFLGSDCSDYRVRRLYSARRIVTNSMKA